MKTFKITNLLVVLICLVILTGFSACKQAPAETVTATTTAWKTSTVTTTVSVPTTITTTLPVTTTVTHTLSATTKSPTTTPFHTSTATTSDPYSKYHGYLLEGYPEDSWPVYGSLAIDTCVLDMQFPAYNSTGVYVNAYKVVYITDKTKEEIGSYYTALLQTVDDQSFYDASGIINGYEVTARWDRDNGKNIVYLYVLLPNSLNITNNPFLADFPETLLPFYKLNNLWNEYFSCTSNYDGTLISSKLFSHSGTKEEALDFYRGLLMDSQDYKETITEEYDGQSITLTGSIDDLSFYVTVGVWGHSNMISIGFQIPQ